MVKRCIDQKLGFRNFDARHEKIETGAVGKSHKGLSGVERGKGVCYQWKEKGQCSKGDRCCFLHESNDRAKPTPKAVPPSGPQNSKTRDSGESRKRNARGRSQSEKFNRPPCKYFLRGTCTKSPCEYWHPPECQFYESESGCKFGAECLFPDWKVEEPSNTKPKRGDDKSAVGIVKSVRQLSCVSQDIEPPESAAISRKGTRILESTRRVRCTRAALRQANIRKKKVRHLGKYKSKFLISEVLTQWNLRTDLQKRLQDKSDAPAEMCGNLPRISCSSKRKTKLHSIHFLRSGFCGPHPQ